MVKKTYMAPRSEVIAEESVELLVVSSSDHGIGYGGVDNDGSKDPDGRSFDYDEDDDVDG